MRNSEEVSLNPQSPILDPVFLQRVSWRCRRGLLELDVVLGRFIEQRYQTLSHEQREVFDELLDLPDTELWALISTQKQPPHVQQSQVLDWLKEA